MLAESLRLENLQQDRRPKQNEGAQRRGRGSTGREPPAPDAHRRWRVESSPGSECRWQPDGHSAVARDVSVRNNDMLGSDSFAVTSPLVVEVAIMLRRDEPVASVVPVASVFGS